MQAPDYQELQSDVFNKLTGRMPQAPKEEIKASVEEAFRAMTDEQKIMSLSEDEVDLLVKFREWSASSASASGAFHWRKQYGK